MTCIIQMSFLKKKIKIKNAAITPSIFFNTLHYYIHYTYFNNKIIITPIISFILIILHPLISVQISNVKNSDGGSIIISVLLSVNIVILVPRGCSDSRSHAKLLWDLQLKFLTWVTTNKCFTFTGYFSF